MYIDKSKGFKIRHRKTGEIKMAYQSMAPWNIVDEEGNEIMSDWELVEEGWGSTFAALSCLLTVLASLSVCIVALSVCYFFIPN